jgi:O-methyltransferase
MPASVAVEMYIELLKRALLGALATQPPIAVAAPRFRGERQLLEARRRVGLPPAKRRIRDPIALLEGRVFPPNDHAYSMIGRPRMDNLADCAVAILREDIPGDFIETGVWRGGASILMKGILDAYGDDTRIVYVADSFQGVPPPDPENYPADAGHNFSKIDLLTVTKAQVKEHFDRFGLLDDRVVFLEGWFKETLPALDKTWALIRLDGDLYESTMDAITALYPSLSPGGFLLIDDYWSIPPCQAAISDYRAEHGITAKIERVDWTGAYWRA